MEDQLRQLAELPAVRAAAIVVGSILVAGLIELVLRRTVVLLTRRTASDLDDTLVEAIRRPLFISVVLIGLAWATGELPRIAAMGPWIDSVLETIAVLIWSGATFRIGVAVLAAIGRRGGGTSIVQARTLPLFDMLLKIVITGAAIYFAFLAWRIDLTAWLASAGIIGLAIAFAAKDTLANLFSGIFIIADAPYKVGDWIVLEGELRGCVTKIGIRSTRVLTFDDIEVTVPNALIANTKIINETGGPYIKQRVRVGVDCAYGSDIDRVREVLLRCPGGIADVASEPVPEVHFLALGAYGLRFELRVWIASAAAREAVLDQLHCAIYKSFAAAGIEIPYAKQDVYIKEMPALPAPRAAS